MNTYCPKCNRIGIFAIKEKMASWHCPWLDCKYRGKWVCDNKFPNETWKQDYVLTEAQLYGKPNI